MTIENFQLKDTTPKQFDTIIDVRSPGEYKEDHIPGAVNLPVLSDDEREIVGKIYKQESKFTAKKIGAKFVSDNISRHLGGLLSDKEEQWTALIYCWRGGQRSRSLGVVLSEIGWQIHILEGGYKSYRRLIVDSLYQNPINHNLLVISGYTGTGKTSVLGELHALGGQVIDLERLANHRGSIFGSRPSRQPSQKQFESQIASLLETFSEKKPVFLEAESSKIGYLKIPPSLWQKMKISSHIELCSKIGERAEFLISEYPELYKDPIDLRKKIELLNDFHGENQISSWQELVDKKLFKVLAQDLMENHYDPRYKNSSNYTEANKKFQIEIDPSDINNVKQVASKILDQRFQQKIN